MLSSEGLSAPQRPGFPMQGPAVQETARRSAPYRLAQTRIVSAVSAAFTHEIVVNRTFDLAERPLFSQAKARSSTLSCPLDLTKTGHLYILMAAVGAMIYPLESAASSSPRADRSRCVGIVRLRAGSPMHSSTTPEVDATFVLGLVGGPMRLPHTVARRSDATARYFAAFSSASMSSMMRFMRRSSAWYGSGRPRSTPARR